MKMPSSSRQTLNSSRNIHCSVATSWIQSAICTATCSTVISQAIAPVAPITSITVALVMKALSSICGTRCQVRSL